MAKKNLVIVGLLSWGVILVSGCAHKAAKPDKTVSAAAAPAHDSSAADEKRFQEVMDMLYKLKGESPPKTVAGEAAPAAETKPAAAGEKTASSPTAPPAPADKGSQAKVEQQKEKAAVPVAAAAPAPVSVPVKAEPAKAAESPEPVLPAPLAETPAASAAPPLSPQDIKDTIKKLVAHPRVRYLSASGEYSYYVGGQIDARYDINDKKLTVSSDGQSANGAVQCQYSNDGRMITDGNPVPPRKTAACDALIQKLLGFLAR